MMTMIVSVIVVMMAVIIMFVAPKDRISDFGPSTHLLRLNAGVVQVVDGSRFGAGVPAEDKETHRYGYQKFFHVVHAPFV